MSNPTAVADTTRLIKFDGDDEKMGRMECQSFSVRKEQRLQGHFPSVNNAVSFTDAIYNSTTSPVVADVKLAYKLNDKGYQFLILSCSEIAFGLVNLAKTADLADGDARLAWKNLTDRYAPHGWTDLIHLTGEFNNSVFGKRNGGSRPLVHSIGSDKVQTILNRRKVRETRLRGGGSHR